MAVYVDHGRLDFGRMKMSHMIADSLEELHAMADQLGLRREWFQAPGPKVSFPHYDVSQTKRELAVRLGAIECERVTFVGHLRRLRPVFGVYGPGNPAPGHQPEEGATSC